MHAELARLVRRRADDAALARPADDHRLALQRRVVALLDRRVERVHVDVEDLAHHCRMLTDVTTPAFLVDRAIVQRNCDAMREKARASGVAFRPHVKTHKSVEIGRMQHGGATGPITVSTLAEAELFADDGFRDITYAVPIAPRKTAARRGLSPRASSGSSVLIDSEDALRAIEEFAASHGVTFDVFLKVDCGYHRAGVDPDEPGQRAAGDRAGALGGGAVSGTAHARRALVQRARRARRSARIAAEEAASLTRFRALLAAEGLGEARRSIGSTPTASVVERFSECDEVRPGNYVFFDAFQSTIGSCALEDVRGVGADDGRRLVSGARRAHRRRRRAGALERRGPEHIDPALRLRPRLRSRPSVRCRCASSRCRRSTARSPPKTHVPVGTRLRIVPNHSCLTAAMFDTYQIVDGEGWWMSGGRCGDGTIGDESRLRIVGSTLLRALPIVNQFL